MALVDVSLCEVLGEAASVGAQLARGRRVGDGEDLCLEGRTCGAGREDGAGLDDDSGVLNRDFAALECGARVGILGDEGVCMGHGRGDGKMPGTRGDRNL